MGDSAVITGKVHPRLTLRPHAVETFCVLLFGVRMPFGVAAERSFGITNELGDVAVDLGSVHWIVGEVPVIVQRLSVMGVNFLVRQPMPSVAGRFVRMDGILTLAARGVTMTMPRRVVPVRIPAIWPISWRTPIAVAGPTGIGIGWPVRRVSTGRSAVAGPACAAARRRQFCRAPA